MHSLSFRKGRAEQALPRNTNASKTAVMILETGESKVLFSPAPSTQRVSRISSIQNLSLRIPFFQFIFAVSEFPSAENTSRIDKRRSYEINSKCNNIRRSRLREFSFVISRQDHKIACIVYDILRPFITYNCTHFIICISHCLTHSDGPHRFRTELQTLLHNKSACKKFQACHLEMSVSLNTWLV